MSHRRIPSIAFLMLLGLVPVQVLAAQTATTKTDPDAYPFNTPTSNGKVQIFTNTWDRLFSGDTHKFSAAISYNSAIASYKNTYNANRKRSQDDDTVNQQLFFSAQYSPVGYFFINTTIQQSVNYFNEYNTKYTYSFGYDDWHRNTFSLVYGNYDGNYLVPRRGQNSTAFETGTITAAYKFGLPKFIDSGEKATCQIGYSITPRYYSDDDEKYHNLKHKALLGCGYNLPYNLFVRGSVFYAPDSNQRQPWDSDFIYSFGYSLYKPGSLSIQYTNYAGTRFPWTGQSSGNAKFSRGTITLSWSLPI